MCYQPGDPPQEFELVPRVIGRGGCNMRLGSGICPNFFRPCEVHAPFFWGWVFWRSLWKGFKIWAIQLFLWCLRETCSKPTLFEGQNNRRLFFVWGIMIWLKYPIKIRSDFSQKEFLAWTPPKKKREEFRGGLQIRLEDLRICGFQVFIMDEFLPGNPTYLEPGAPLADILTTGSLDPNI